MTKLTASQLAVVTNAGDHLLVDAGAGSGKTTTVVQAICHQLGVNVTHEPPIVPVAVPLAFEQVAAITFTNQAAADLKRKLRAALRAGGRRDLAAEVDSARIGTIHGFCGDLLRDFALRAGARPGRRVLEEGEGSAIAGECARDALRLAIERGDVPGLDELLSGRQLKHVSPWIVKIADDTDRLAHWDANRAALRPHELALLEIAKSAVKIRQDLLDREGVLDFDRMIVETRDLLRNDGVRRAVQQRIRLLVLDEFQDVDPAQRDIAFLLGGLTHDDPAPTRIILVGDPKQSIYRFRRADVTLWNAVAERFAAGAGKVLPLADNFRSKEAILGLVDHAVGPALDGAVAEDGVRRDFEVKYAPLEPCAEGATGDHAVEFLVVPPDEEGKALNAEGTRLREATAVARRIRELSDDGTPLGDIAILLAGWADVEKYADALRLAGVPTYVLRSEGFWQEREVLDCLLALRAVRDKADDVAMVGFLKSPFVGVRDDTLFALARHANGAPLHSALGHVAAERELLDGASSLLSGLGALRDRVSVHELLVRLLDESGFLAVLALDPANGQQAIANVRKLVRVAAATPGQSLGEFLRTVAEQRDRGDRVAPERLYRERSNVVTITSVHSAKGLEWPVVFWCDLVRGLTGDKESCIAGRDAFCVKQADADDEEGDGKDAMFKDLAAQLALEHRAEAYRLWYVATTRAKQRLVLSGIPLGTMKKAFSPATALRAAFATLGAGAEVEYANHRGELFHATVRFCDGAAAPEALPPERAIELPLPPAALSVPVGRTRLSASQLMAFVHDPTRWWDLYVRRFDGGAAGGAAGGVSRAGASAMATGVIVHEVLERYEAEGVDLGELIDDVIANNDRDAPEVGAMGGEAWRAHIRARVAAAVESPVWQEVAASPSARRELTFTRVFGDGTTINGALDLAAREGHKARIIDVKNSSADGAALAERYEIQAAVYVDAVRAIGGAGTARFSLLTVPAGVTADVAPTADVEALVAQLRGWRAVR